MMPKPYPREFRDRAVALVLETGLPVSQVAKDLQISAACVAKWVDQARIESGEKPGQSCDGRAETVELWSSCSTA